MENVVKSLDDIVRDLSSKELEKAYDEIRQWRKGGSLTEGIVTDTLERNLK